MTTALLIQNKLNGFKERAKRTLERDTEILEKYATIPDASYRSLAVEYGISMPRVQQIVQHSLAKARREGVLPE